MQTRVLENILVLKYVKSNGCFAINTGLSSSVIGYSWSRPVETNSAELNLRTIFEKNLLPNLCLEFIR